jgi:hypothetical protein
MPEPRRVRPEDFCQCLRWGFYFYAQSHPMTDMQNLRNAAFLNVSETIPATEGYIA